MKVTTKGQVTIPRQIRRHLNITPHDEVNFVLVGGRVVLQKDTSVRNDVAAQIAAMRGTADMDMTTDEIMSMTRGDE